MKKILAASALTILLSLLITIPVYANNVQVTIDEIPVVFTGQQPVIIEGNTFIPLRVIFEQLGYDVIWRDFGEFRQVSITDSVKK